MPLCGLGVAQPFKLVQRLTPEVVTAVAERYESGESAGPVAASVGISRSALVDLLRSQGVRIRRERLTETQRAEIIGLYRSGITQADIARRVGRDPGHVWHVLRRAGIVGRGSD